MPSTPLSLGVLMARFEEVKVKHVIHECNFVADHLENLGNTFGTDLCILGTPHVSMSNILYGDSIGICFDQLVPTV